LSVHNLVVTGLLLLDRWRHDFFVLIRYVNIINIVKIGNF
jgi:hypothetical protein